MIDYKIMEPRTDDLWLKLADSPFARLMGYGDSCMVLYYSNNKVVYEIQSLINDTFKVYCKYTNTVKYYKCSLPELLEKLNDSVLKTALQEIIKWSDIAVANWKNENRKKNSTTYTYNVMKDYLEVYNKINDVVKNIEQIVKENK